MPRRHVLEERIDRLWLRLQQAGPSAAVALGVLAGLALVAALLAAGGCASDDLKANSSGGLAGAHSCAPASACGVEAVDRCCHATDCYGCDTLRCRRLDGTWLVAWRDCLAVDGSKAELCTVSP